MPQTAASPDRTDPVDVIIVGAGAAGALFAARLAEAGRRTVVYEAGPDWKAADLISSQLWARRLKWGAPPVERGGSHPFGHNMAVGWGVGGSALHHYAGWPRLHPEDFRTHSLHSRGRDWPVDYDTLRPHYDRMQTEMGVSGDAEREVWRPAGEPYPMPPIPTFPQAERLAQGFAKLGMRVAPSPLAINTTTYQDRSVCLYDGWCDAGCPIGALANPLVTHVPQSRQAGAQIIAETWVTKVTTDSRGKIDGVEFVTAAGERKKRRAALVILAGAPVQNARLLLNSDSDRHPGGLGNDHGQVGKYFSCHMVAGVYGLFPEDLQNHFGVSAGTLICQDRYGKTSYPGAFGSSQWGIGPALKPNDLLGIANTRTDLFGTQLDQFLRSDAKRLGAMSALCEVVNETDSRIELTDTRDPRGMPLARIVNSLSPASLALHEAVTKEGLSILRAAGATSAWAGPMAFAHPLGGTIMGNDPRASVTDSYGRVHGIPNLVVAGGSLFPTAGGGSPTFTIYALADRTTQRMASHPKEFAS